MSSYYSVTAVTLVALLVYFGMGLAVARARGKAGIQPPAMTGDPILERTIRAHINTLEWMPIFLPSLWLFAIYWNPTWAAIFGMVWIIGRIVYFIGYVSAVEKRSMGFLVQFLAAAALLLGTLGRIAYLAITNT